jgi:hypothetical protein
MLGEFETALQGEMEPIADIMKYVIDNQIPGNLTIHSSSGNKIHIGHIGTGPGQDRAVRVVQTYSSASGKVGVRRIEWVPGHTKFDGSKRPIRLVRGSVREMTRANVYSMAQRPDLTAFALEKDSEIEKGKNLLLPSIEEILLGIELRIGSLGPLHKFELGNGCVHHISNELGKSARTDSDKCWVWPV